MKIYSSILFIILFAITIGHASFASEVSSSELLHTLTTAKGVEYRNQINSLLKKPELMSSMLQLVVNNDNESMQKKILSAWQLKQETFDGMLNAMNRYEYIARSSVRPYKPSPVSFAKPWLSHYGESLTLLAVETVWKRDDWPEWRTLAMIEILKLYAEDDMLAPIVDRLQTEKNDKIRRSILELLMMKGGAKTLAHLGKSETKMKEAFEQIRDCSLAIRERINRTTDNGKDFTTVEKKTDTQNSTEPATAKKEAITNDK